jgi:chromosome partitioning protein
LFICLTKAGAFEMTHVISMINLKGGVAKTTTAVALAEVFSAEKKIKVLLIDLDPQTNLTIMMLGDEKWKGLNDRGFTLFQLFKDALEPENKKFDYDNALQKNVGDVAGADTIDLLPSSLELIDIQDKLASSHLGKFFLSPIEILYRAVKAKISFYDIVIIDCPPTLGLVTLNGLRISQGFVIPTIPDYLSTYGIKQILSRTSIFAKEIGENLTPLGVVITKFQANSNVHHNLVRQLRNDPNGPKIYKTKIKQSNNVSAAAEFMKDRRTLRQKYGSGDDGLASEYVKLADEIWSDLEAMP